MIRSYRIHVKGLVQGVGFRPMVYTLAMAMGLKGDVCNGSDGVQIHINAEEQDKAIFLTQLQKQKPPHAEMMVSEVQTLPYIIPYTKFSIIPSIVSSMHSTRISPDIATCEQCLCDIKQSGNRFDYLFTNCTHCGPRFSIIESLPYDRPRTTMQHFAMCSACRQEYQSIEDRRFHAQPTACSSCGPHYSINSLNKSTSLNVTTSLLLEQITDHLNAGNILSLKGIGGYVLLCDAYNDATIKKLRMIKGREQKPFAILVDSLETAQSLAEISEKEATLLTSSRRPIVLLKIKQPVSEMLNGGLRTLGIMLPYLPIHTCLFEKLKTSALVYTSGNLKNCPLISDNQEAQQILLPHVTMQAEHNREIANRVDDSVVQVIQEQEHVLRRARGYTPDPLLTQYVTEGILAFGAENTASFTIGKAQELIVSQHIGDLKGYETLQFYKESLNKFSTMFQFIPQYLVCDLHPYYLSTQIAETYASAYQIPLYRIQHHHAHAAACMIENNQLMRCLSIVLDGTGYGTDHTIWGSEFLITDLYAFERMAHFDYIPLPGGDRAAKEPWRSAVAYLLHYGLEIPSDFIARIGKAKIDTIEQIIVKQINAPLGCGMGRLFDAVASLVGICDYTRFQSEAPIRLEHLAATDCNAAYPLNKSYPLDMKPLLDGLLTDLKQATPLSICAAKFHNTVIKAVSKQAIQLIEEHHLPHKVMLAGGCFLNKYLTAGIITTLNNEGMEVYVNHQYSSNDESISLGQAAIIAARKAAGLIN